MKNKWYYTLFIFYFGVFGFVLYLNGVFGGEITSYSNLLINVAILLVIGVLFVMAAVHFAKLNRCTDALELAASEIAKTYKEKGGNLWNEYKDAEALFHHPVLDNAYRRYQKRMKSYTTRRGLNNSCDLEEYINEDLLDEISSAHFNSSISGTMTGLGILGTFLGLSLGLGAFSGNDIFTISDNVGPLLDGMKVAFHTSVYGIFFSLIFTFIYRGIMAYSYQVLENFLSCYRECVTPVMIPGTDENTKAMLLYQANMANSMKSILDLLQGSSLEQTKSVEQMVDNFSKQLSEAMKTDFAKLGASLNAACDAQSIYAHNYQAMEKTTKELLEANRMIQETLEHTIHWQERFSKELKQQQQKLEETCNTLTDDISNQLYTLNMIQN